MSTGPPVSRSAATSTDHPGSLIHVDVKTLGNIPDGAVAGGSSGAGKASRTATPPGAAPAARTYYDAHVGTAYVHTVIDDHSRVAYAEIHEDQTKETAAEVLRNAVAWFDARGVTIERVLSDNGGCYRSFLWRDTCLELGITHSRTGPTGPRPTAS